MIYYITGESQTFLAGVVRTWRGLPSVGKYKVEHLGDRKDKDWKK